jgi:hypothetical protein
LAKRREAQWAAVERLEAALKSGTDEDVVLASRRVRELGAAGPHIRWDAVYLIEERYTALEAFREALASGDDARLADAWCTLRGRWDEYLSQEEHQAGQRAFQKWGRNLRTQSIPDEHESK